jgi:hypothetical protein
MADMPTEAHRKLRDQLPFAMSSVLPTSPGTRVPDPTRVPAQPPAPARRTPTPGRVPATKRTGS